MTDKYWYELPMQVRFIREGVYSLGIAFQKYIIDCVDGMLFSLDKVYDDAAAIYKIDSDSAVVEWCTWEPFMFAKAN